MADLLTPLLDSSSPGVTRSLASRELVGSLARETEPSRLRRPRVLRGRFFVPSIIVIGVIGGASAAVASPAVETILGYKPTVTFPWTPNSAAPAETCTASVEVVAGSTSDTPGTRAALARARVLVRSLDFSQVEKSSAYLTAYNEGVVHGSAGPAETRLIRERYALGMTVQTLVGEQLSKEGLDATAVGISGSDDCRATN